MLRPRIIPTLLVHDGGLVKTIGFKDPKYVGDPINAVKIFNEKEADELVVLDIDATAKGQAPDYRMIANLAAECRMPLCYGGGIGTVEQAEKIISLGVEKVALSAAAIDRPGLLTEIAERVGRQSVVAIIDVLHRSGGLFRKDSYEVTTLNATRSHNIAPLDLAETLAHAGAGEIVVNSVDRDGTMTGYDLELAAAMRERIDIPITILGGAGSLDDMSALLETCGTVGASAGSLFVFKGALRAVLINYPVREVKDAIYAAALRQP